MKSKKTGFANFLSRFNNNKLLTFSVLWQNLLDLMTCLLFIYSLFLVLQLLNILPSTALLPISKSLYFDSKLFWIIPYTLLKPNMAWICQDVKKINYILNLRKYIFIVKQSQSRDNIKLSFYIKVILRQLLFQF